MQTAAAALVQRQRQALGREGRPAGERAVLVAALAAWLALLAAAWWGVAHLVPDQLRLSLLGHAKDVAGVHGKIADYGLLMGALLPAALWIECWVVGWRKSSARRLLVNPTASNRTDIAYFLLGQPHLTDLAGRVLTLGASMLSGAWLHDRLSALAGVPLRLIPPSAPFALQVVVFFAVYSFFDYWTHRLDHSRWFWPLHRYHHAAEEFSVVNATRAHPAAFTGVFLVNMPMAILGAPAEVMVYVNLVVLSLGFLIHSRIDSDWGWIGRWVLQSPNHHRLHHILDISLVPAGHFSMAPLWDRLFGTWRGDADQSLAIGVETAYRHGFWIVPDIARDYLDFWRGLLRRPALD